MKWIFMMILIHHMFGMATLHLRLNQTTNAMKVTEKYNVISIESDQTYDWLLNKHYAKRIPSISYAFGLYCDKILVGILTIGKPASPSLCDGVCGKEYSQYVYELNRLCVNDNLEKNSLSFFVGKCLKLIPNDMILVSYADTLMNHNGYIYQATNWIYTGATKERTDIGFEDGTHSRHYSKDIDYSIRKFRSSKHRYIFFVGKLKKQFKSCLKYAVLPYPKGENKKYDASYQPQIQINLF
jgi:hypothetical protein